MPRPKLYLPSEKQTAIVRARMAGKSNKQIARELGVTVSAVRSHLNSYHSKLKSLDPHWSDGLSAIASFHLRELKLTPEDILKWAKISQQLAGQYDKKSIIRAASRALLKDEPQVSHDVLRLPRSAKSLRAVA